MNYKKLSTEEELMKVCSEYKEIMLYGCGEVGKALLRRLQHRGINISGFIVTNGGGVEVEGIGVCSVNEVSNFWGLVIVTTKENIQEEILLETLRCNIRHVVCISNELFWEIKHKVKKPREKLLFNVHIAEHCNLNCKGCYHFSSIAAEEYLMLEEYSKDIRRLSDLFHGEMDQIFIMGGEPLLHPDVEKFFVVTRKYFPSGKIKLLTNGILLEKMKDKFWQIVNETRTEIWVTKYPINLNWERIETFATDKGSKIYYFNREPVRTLGHQPIDVSGERNYIDNFDGCYRANQCILLEHGRMYTCFLAAVSRHFNKFFGMKLNVSKEDYIDIYDVSSGQELLERLTKPTPFCKYCNRDDIDAFGRIPWEQTQKKMEEWTE